MCPRSVYAESKTCLVNKEVSNGYMPRKPGEGVFLKGSHLPLEIKQFAAKWNTRFQTRKFTQVIWNITCQTGLSKSVSVDCYGPKHTVGVKNEWKKVILFFSVEVDFNGSGIFISKIRFFYFVSPLRLSLFEWLFSLSSKMGISLRSIFVELSLRQLVSERVPFAMVIVVAMGFEMLRLYRGSSLRSRPVRRVVQWITGSDT